MHSSSRQMTLEESLSEGCMNESSTASFMQLQPLKRRCAALRRNRWIIRDASKVKMEVELKTRLAWGQLTIIDRTVSRPVLALTFVLLTHFDYWLPQNVAIDARTYGAPQYGHATTRTTNYAMATKCGCHWVTSRFARSASPHPRQRHPAATPLFVFPPRRKCNIEMKSKLIRVLGPSLMNCQWVSSLVRRGVPAGGRGVYFEWGLPPNSFAFRVPSDTLSRENN